MNSQWEVAQESGPSIGYGMDKMPVAEPPIAESMAVLQKFLAESEELVLQLENRLTPVLRGRAPEKPPSNSANTAQSAESPLHGQLLGSTRQAANVMQGIRELMSRLVV